MWPKNWRIVDDAAKRAGGQGTVTKVASLADGRLGALKKLHETNQKITERRYRMQQEALALKVLEGNGTPLLLDSNVEQWQDKDVSLFVVMEWIDGPNLADACSKRPLELDQALSVTRGILLTIERCHEISIHHRDLKPDNVVLRNGKKSTPVLVDFGTAWARPYGEETSGYETRPGMELGNRFLRLPEYAPNQDGRDNRSDLTMLVGLLYFMLTQKAPRQLLDPKERMPHQRGLDQFPDALQQDQCWDRLTRIFNVGFQLSIEKRFQDTEILRRYLDLSSPRRSGVIDEAALLNEKLDEIADLVDVRTVQAREVNLSTIQAGNQRFHQRLQQLLSPKNIDFSGPNPQIAHAENEIHQERRIRLSKISKSPAARYQHYLHVEAGVVIAKAKVEKGALEEYYRGPVSDPESLFEAAESQASSLAVELLSALGDKLSQLAS